MAIHQAFLKASQNKIYDWLGNWLRSTASAWAGG